MTLRSNSPEIVLNDQSGRKTDNLVGFDISGERVFGSRAAQLRAKYPHRVISSAHQFLGKQFPDSAIENSQHLFPFELVNNNGTYGFQIDEDIYTPEEIVGMTIEFAQNMAYTTTNSRPTECTLVVPPSITQLERQGYINAAKIAGLNVISLVHEGSGAAVQYLRSRLLGEEDLEQYTIFYNVGAGHTSATLTRFLIQKPGKTVTRKIITNTTAWEEVGGRDFDYRLTKFLLAKAEEQFKRDLSSNARVIARLTKEARKAKEVLSANKEAHVRVESLTNDQDFSTRVTREEFENMCSDLFDRVLAPIRNVLERTTVDTSLIDVEVIGGGSRVVKINNLLFDLFSEERVGRHMNGDESSLSGAMLYAATSSAGKKSSFIVKDTFNRAVGLKCDAPEFEPYTFIKPESRYNSKKNLNFVAQDTTICQFYYEDADALSTGILPDINAYEISGFPDISLLSLAEDEPSPSVRVRCDIDNRGVIDCTEANLRVSVIMEPEAEPEPEPEAEPEPEPEPEAEIPTDEAENVGNENEEDGSKSGEEQQETNENETEEDTQDGIPEEIVAETEDSEKTESGAGSTEGSDVEEVVPAVKIRHFELKVKKLENKNELEAGKIHEYRSRLAKLNREDKKRAQLLEIKNELEAYVYATLEFLDNEDAQSVSTSDERDTFSADLLEAGDWLYDDGEDATLEEYQEKMETLRAVGDKIQLRVAELENRPRAAAMFHEWKEVTLASLENIVEERNVGEDERDEFIDSIRELESWLEGKQEEQAAIQLFDDPVWTSSELSEKALALDNKAKRLLRRRKRTPTPSPTPVVTIDGDDLGDDNAGDAAGENGEPLDFDFENIDFGVEDEIPIPVVDEEKPIHEEL
eukprot:CAMPEP_0117023644 /NCGR_PEP_ID=MMETSP0472-20121206/17629_1 /TAXON_ID=693140 ORGANISM="Tiarina fusus, Strain LIS" /NCGR_SAMPLE_ID=MMETSP0472 /ASSEMBLY_ACC=CAM_ASM_000603 /LENGTH=864 /DNA_ID=CAMNT_0004729829 /DNA_START=146 /DNA_END=2740 /DNA_ORIENTATION=-